MNPGERTLAKRIVCPLASGERFQIDVIDAFVVSSWRTYQAGPMCASATTALAPARMNPAA